MSRCPTPADSRSACSCDMHALFPGPGRRDDEPMHWIGDVPVFGEPVDPGALEQIQRCRATAEAAVLMADHHLGYAVPIGGVVAYKDAISPSGVGFDIGCGNKAVRTDMPAAEARAKIASLMDDIASRLSFGMGQKNKRRVESEVFERDEWRLPEAAKLKSLARDQLGTIGSGNHYVDLFTDEQDRVWVGVHFGSRGLGHKLATHFLRAGGAKDGMHVPPLVLRRKQALFDHYVAAMRLAGAYAHAGRDWVCREVARILGARARRGHAGDDALLGARPGGGAAGCGHGRGAPVLQAAAGGADAPCRHDPGAAHAAADRRGDGGGARGGPLP